MHYKFSVGSLFVIVRVLSAHKQKGKTEKSAFWFCVQTKQLLKLK